MTDSISLAIASLSLAISGLTAWLTLIRRGKIGLSRPMVVYFGPDNYTDKRNVPKVYIRSLLFSTSKRGQIIESIHVRVTSKEARQNFNIWVYGEHGKFVRGSGLYVGEAGVSCDHHFLPPPEYTDFKFREEIYRLDVFIKMLKRKPIKNVFSEKFIITNALAKVMENEKLGIYFDWSPDSQAYRPRLDEAPRPSPSGDDLVRSLARQASFE